MPNSARRRSAGHAPRGRRDRHVVVRLGSNASLTVRTTESRRPARVTLNDVLAWITALVASSTHDQRDVVDRILATMGGQARSAPTGARPLLQAARRPKTWCVTSWSLKSTSTRRQNSTQIAGSRRWLPFATLPGLVGPRNPGSSRDLTTCRSPRSAGPCAETGGTAGAPSRRVGAGPGGQLRPFGDESPKRHFLRACSALVFHRTSHPTQKSTGLVLIIRRITAATSRSASPSGLIRWSASSASSRGRSELGGRDR